jgi:hypothetical protein
MVADGENRKGEMSKSINHQLSFAAGGCQSATGQWLSGRANTKLSESLPAIARINFGRPTKKVIKSFTNFGLVNPQMTPIPQIEFGKICAGPFSEMSWPFLFLH